MTPAEIVHRLREHRVKAQWRTGAVGWDEAVGDGSIRQSALLRERLATAHITPSLKDGVDRAARGQLRFFGREWPVVNWIDDLSPDFWQHDPVTKQRWPGSEVPSLDIDLRSTGLDPEGPRLGDVKFVWEPGRLQFLHPLAAAAAGGDAQAAATALEILRAFSRANAPYRGIHWSSGIELALRLASLTLLCASLAPNQLGASERTLVRRLAVSHARYLSTFPSLHSSANNHRVAEGLGLFLAGRLLPDIGGGWEREGREIIESETPRLILSDGGGAEQSLVYLAFTMEMIAFASLVASESDRPFDPTLLDRLAQGAKFLRAMLDSSGCAPAIGDDDETRVIGQPPDREPRYVASVVAAIAGLTGRPELLPPDRDPHLRDALFAVANVAGPVSEAMSTFREAGYTTIHERIDARLVDLVFDHGPLGYNALAAHGHADALSVWLSVDGVQVLIDAGTYLYHSGGVERLRMRESPSHNGLSVRGMSHSRASSAFGWSNRAAACLVEASDRPAWSVTAEHDGFRRRFGVIHRRRIARDEDSIAICDELIGLSAPLSVEIRFLLPADLDLEVDGQSVSIGQSAKMLCRITGPNGFAVTVQRGAAEKAVRSRRFGEMEAAQRIVFSGLLGQSGTTTRFGFGREGTAAASAGLAHESLSTPSCGA